LTGEPVNGNGVLFPIGPYGSALNFTGGRPVKSS
jgi:hypothetical protein